MKANRYQYEVTVSGRHSVTVSLYDCTKAISMHTGFIDQRILVNEPHRHYFMIQVLAESAAIAACIGLKIAAMGESGWDLPI